MAGPQGEQLRRWFDEDGWKLDPDELRAYLEEHGADTDTIIGYIDEGADRRRAQPHAAPAAARNGATRRQDTAAAPAPPAAVPENGQVPPQNLEAEESVLGAMMLSPGAIKAVRRHLADDGRQFYRESHARIYRAAVALHDRGEPVDAITLTDELEERGQLDDAGGRVRLHELAALVPATANAAHYAKIVVSTAVLRDLIRGGGEMARLGWDRPAELDELIDRSRDIVKRLEQAMPRDPIRISWGRDFVAQETETVRVLLGTDTDKVLPAHGFALVYGKGAAGKTTLTLTAVAALASGTPWLNIPVSAPVRILMVENEGPKAPFLEKIARFADQWDGPDFLHNVGFYEEPWARFNVADRGMRDDLLAFTRDQKIDLVVAGPLRGLGMNGPGAPSETDAFLDLLKEAGLGTELAWWIVHHVNKAGQVSGDWDRHPDTLIRYAYEGKRRNRLIWEKVRWGDQGREPLVLEWLDDAVGYRIIDTQSEEIDWLDVEHRVLAVIEANPRCSQRKVEELAGGKATHVRETIRRLLEQNRLTNDGKGGKKVLTVTADAAPTLPVDTDDLEWT